MKTQHYMADDFQIVLYYHTGKAAISASSTQ